MQIVDAATVTVVPFPPSTLVFGEVTNRVAHGIVKQVQDHNGGIAPVPIIPKTLLGPLTRAGRIFYKSGNAARIELERQL